MLNNLLQIPFRLPHKHSVRNTPSECELLPTCYILHGWPSVNISNYTGRVLVWGGGGVSGFKHSATMSETLAEKYQDNASMREKELFINATKCVAKARILPLAWSMLYNLVKKQTKTLIIVTQHCGQVRIHSLQQQLEPNICLETMG